MGSPNTDFDVTNDVYYRRMKAKDRDGNISIARSNTGRFEAVELNDRDINEKNNANLSTYYDSNEITLDGIKPGVSVWATVDGD
jgi:CTP-dependent riboflavin kinase